MVKHITVQTLGALSLFFFLCYWLLGYGLKDARSLQLAAQIKDSAHKVADERAKAKDLYVKRLEKNIELMTLDIEKAKVAHDAEIKGFKDENVRVGFQLVTLKKRLEEKKELEKEKDNTLRQLERRIYNISKISDQLSETNRKLKSDVTKDIVKPYMGMKLVHFDLKGAPPKVSYLIEVMKYSKQWGAGGFLIEYEDMFPWERELGFLARSDAYTKDDIRRILRAASDQNMVVIPLIQTFGHLEFVLKHKDFKHLRADKDITNTICPINKGSIPLLKKMIAQILEMHRHSKWIHLGGDEVYNLVTCEKCRASNLTDFQIYTHHMIQLFNDINTKRTAEGEIVKPIIWDDMMREWSATRLSMMAKHVTPMVWAYVADLSNYHNFPDDMWDRYLKAFPEIWIASSFKGALKPWSNFPPIKQHLDNHLSWLKIVTMLESKGAKVTGIALTGWSRFDHYGPLCELLPAGIPSLAVCLSALQNGGFDRAIHKAVSEKLGFDEPFKIGVSYFKTYNPEKASYPGANIYRFVGTLEKAIGWYDWSNVRKTGWMSSYRMKNGFLSFYQLNTTLHGVQTSIEIVKELRNDAYNILSPIFKKGTVDEWIDDKIVNRLNMMTNDVITLKSTIDKLAHT